jgi:chromosome segregation ATPase
MSFYKRVKKINSHKDNRLSSIKGRKLNFHTPSSSQLSRNLGASVHQQPSSQQPDVIYQQHHPDNELTTHVRELANEVIDQIKSVNRRVDDLETNIDQQQFNVLQKTLTLNNTLPPPNESFEDFENEFNTRLNELSKEVNSIRNDLTKETPQPLSQDDIKPILSSYQEKFLSELNQLKEKLESQTLTADIIRSITSDMKRLKQDIIESEEIHRLKDLTSQQIVSLGAFNDKLDQTHNQLHHDINVTNQAVKDLTLTVNQIQSDLKTTQSTIANVKDETNESIQKVVAITNETIDSLKGFVATTNETIDSIQKSVATTNETVDSLKGFVATTNETVDSIQKSVATTNETVDSIQKSVATTNETVDSLKGFVATTNETVDSIQKSVAAVNQSISLVETTQQSSISTTKENLDLLRSEMSELISFVNSASKTFDDQTSEISRIDTQVSELAQKMEKHDSALLESISSSMTPEDKSVFATVVSSLDEIKQDVINVKGDVNVVKGDMSAVKGEVNIVKDGLDLTRKDVHDHQTTLGELKTLVGGVESEIRSIDDKVSQVVNQSLHTIVQNVSESLQKLETNTTESLQTLENKTQQKLDTFTDELTKLTQSTKEGETSLTERLTRLESDLSEEKVALEDALHVTENSLHSTADDIQGIKFQLGTMKYDMETQLAYEVGKLDSRITHAMSSSPNDVEGRLSEEIAALKSKVDENEQTVKSTVNSTIEHVNSTIDHVNTTLQSSLAEMNQSIEKLTEVVHVNEFTAEMSRDRVEKIKSDINSKQELIDELRQRLDQLSASLSNDMETLKQSVVYKDQIEEADVVADEFDDKITRIKAEFRSELETQVHKLQDEIDQLVDRKLSRLDTASPFEEKLNQEMMHYKEQVQSLRNYLQDMQAKQTVELSSIKEQYNTLSPLSRFEECQREIQSVEGRIATILSDLDQLQRDSKSSQAVTEEVRTSVNAQSIALEQIPTIKQNILQIEQKIDEIKQEFKSHVIESEQTVGKLDSLTSQVISIEKKSDELNEKTESAARRALDLSETCRLLDEEYKLISGTFKSQYDTLQRRYQELHTIMVSNMEETERGNQSVRELIDLHARIEHEYKELTSSYEQQQEAYKTSLQQRDDRLKLLEDQFKQQLDQVGSQLSNLQEQGDSSYSRTTHSARIEELAQPRHITQKKII